MTAAPSVVAAVYQVLAHLGVTVADLKPTPALGPPYPRSRSTCRAFSPQPGLERAARTAPTGNEWPLPGPTGGWTASPPATSRP